MMKNQKGFTLIELLVVIAIIGLLATISIISLSTARQKARDAKRLSDVKQMSTAFELMDIEASGQTIDCNGTLAVASPTDDCAEDVGNVNAADWSGTLKDPSAAADGNLCDGTATSICHYSLDWGSATTSDYEVCFWMEAGNNIGAGNAGLKRISTGGVFSDGCGF